MKKLLLATLISSGLLLGLSNANATPYQHKTGHMKAPGYHHMHKKMTPEMKQEMAKRKAEIDKRLNITPEQKAELKAIHEEGKKQIAPKIKLLTEAEYELNVIEKREFNKDTFGIATLEEVQLSGKTKEQLREEIKTLRNEIREIKKATFEASQKIFTDEQKKELEKMRKERKAKMMHKHHKMKHKK